MLVRVRVRAEKEAGQHCSSSVEERMAQQELGQRGVARATFAYCLSSRVSIAIYRCRYLIAARTVLRTRTASTFWRGAASQSAGWQMAKWVERQTRLPPPPAHSGRSTYPIWSRIDTARNTAGAKLVPLNPSFCHHSTSTRWKLEICSPMPATAVQVESPRQPRRRVGVAGG